MQTRDLPRTRIFAGNSDLHAGWDPDAVTTPFPEQVARSTPRESSETLTRLDHSQGVATPCRVLLVDDDRALREAVARALRIEGYEVTMASDGRDALALLSTQPAELVLLDISMPSMSGIDVCRRLRGADDLVPVLMLTARDRVRERVAGLDAGADDYLVKPFALDELLARVRALTRRRDRPSTSVAGSPGGELKFLDITLDAASHTASRGGSSLALTPTEFSLLEAFLLHPRRVLSRAFIYAEVWGADMPVTSKVLEVYLGYLRGKLEGEHRPRLIHTVRSVGYVLRAEP